MPADQSLPDARDEQLCAIILSYLESAESGCPPDREELCVQHPELASDIRDYPSTHDRLEAMSVRLRRAVETSGPWDRRSRKSEAVADEPAGSPSVGDFAPGARYRLLAEVARGGMGVVFRGYDTLLGRDIAFKFLRERYRNDPEMRRRFAREARITARLQHPGIVPVYEQGQTADGRPYFTMSLIRGRTLAALLEERRDPARDVPHFLKIFEQVCQAVAYAHARGVIHRDLKPANVMVSPFGVVQVMDWGLAKYIDGECEAETESAGDTTTRIEETDKPCPGEGQTPVDFGSGSHVGCSVGTPGYMPPEQARGEGVDERADVFGLGAILCVILTGRPPYATGPEAEVRARAAAGELAEAFARLDASLAEREVIELAKHCLAADPRERFRNAGEMVAAVTTYLESDLRRAERDLVRFFDLSPDLFCLAGLDGFFRRVNINFSRVLGHTERELRARPFLDFVHPDDRERTLAAMEKLSQGLPVIRFINRYRDAQGGYRRFEWTGKSIPEEGVIFAVARDVTDWVEAEAPRPRRTRAD
jgi:serine/threonine-protein kinase